MKVVRNLIVTAVFLGVVLLGAAGISREYVKDVTRVLGFNDDVTVSALEDDFSENIKGRNVFLKLAGKVQSFAGLRTFYSDEGIYITHDKVIEAAYPETSTDYEYESVVDFAKYLSERGIRFLYVNQPTKYLDDDEFIDEFGVETYSNRNADKLIGRLRDSGIEVLDLRESIKEEGLDVKSMFYRTDHHWTVPTGLWAAEKMAERLNEDYGYDIDLSVYDIENFRATEYRNAWLGEQGKKVGENFVGLDDFTLLEPDWDTHYIFYDPDEVFEGTFEDFLVRDVIHPELDVYDNYSWHYAYARKNAENLNAPYGNVLIICDSYEQTAEPFLTLGINGTTSLILRDELDDFSVKWYAAEYGYDTVILAYSQLWIGCHDNPESTNYDMYTFK